MKGIEELLRNLAKQDVTELVLISGRLPCVRVRGSFEPVDDAAPTDDQILGILMSVGGSRHVDGLGPEAKQWTWRIGGVGIIAISAVMPRDGEVQARFSLAQKDERKGPAHPSNAKNARVGARNPTRRDIQKVSLKPSPRKPSQDRMAAHKPGHGRDEVVLDKNSLPPPTLETGKRPSVPASVVAEKSAARRISTPPPRSVRPPPAKEPERAAAPVDSDPETPRMDVSSPATPITERGADGMARADGLRQLEGHLKTARAAGATDLHVVAGRPLLLRVGGDLKPRGEPLAVLAVNRMLEACVPERLAPSFRDQGLCDFALEVEGVGRFRVNVARQQTGLKATVRVIPREIPTLEALGLPAAIAGATKHHQGLIVVTGPTGHGKTTTLAAIVDILNRDTTSHIITVEDPIEYVHPKKRAVISQREVGTHTRSFGSALKGSLREDPDVIVVGELRDTETVRMAVAASETGHLVLGTMNTPSAAKTIDRLIDLFPPADQPQVRTSLASGLRLIVGQRLVPGVDKAHIFAAAEVLPGSIPLSALIRENKTFQIPSLQQRSKALGIIRLDDSLADLVHGLHVSLETAKAFAEAPNEIEALVGMRRSGPRGPGDRARGMFAGKA